MGIKDSVTTDYKFFIFHKKKKGMLLAERKAAATVWLHYLKVKTLDQIN